MLSHDHVTSPPATPFLSFPPSEPAGYSFVYPTKRQQYLGAVPVNSSDLNPRDSLQQRRGGVEGNHMGGKGGKMAEGGGEEADRRRGRCGQFN